MEGSFEGFDASGMEVSLAEFLNSLGGVLTAIGVQGVSALFR